MQVELKGGGPMDTGRFRFTVGTFDCVSLSDGTFNYPLEAFFANVPKEEVEDVLRRHALPTDRITTPYTCLYVDTGQHRVLVDTGAGNLAAAAPMMFPSIDHATTETGTLLRNLEATGIDRSTIDTVIISHAHPDHVGGTLDDDGALVFGNARYVVPRIEWDFWMSEAATARAPAPMVDIARRNLDAMRDRLTRVDDGTEIAPGIRVIAARAILPGTWPCPSPRTTSRCCTSPTSCSTRSIWSIPTGFRSSTSCRSRPRGASAASSTARRRSGHWCSPTIFRLSQIWATSTSRREVGSGNRSRGRNRLHALDDLNHLTVRAMCAFG
jgi:hypothetical protein